MTAPGSTPVRMPIIRNANRLRSAGTGAVSASRSHHLYSVREAEVRSPSNTALTAPSNNVITLTIATCWGSPPDSCASIACSLHATLW